MPTSTPEVGGRTIAVESTEFGPSAGSGVTGTLRSNGESVGNEIV